MARYRVLLIEPNQELRRILRDYLARCDFEVTEAGDAPDALHAARRERPDLILCDSVLPGADGPSFARALRSEPDVRNIPLILLASAASPEDRLSYIESGADDYLLKPFSMRELAFRTGRQILLSRRADPGELVGDLASFKIADVLQILEANQATGVLQLEGADLAGEIHLLDGYICGGFAGNHRGEDAVYRLIPMRRGRFHFSRNNIRSNIEVVRSTTEFMMEAFRRHDEKARELTPSDQTA